ncbi:MAG: glycosyltransferase [Patescibacteria group bacterium]
MKPKVSFIIATKNRAGLIGETIKSLLGQTVKEWEAIIVDDHGTDDTMEVVNQFRDNRLRYFKLIDAHGSGVSCARNFAALHAMADIATIMDSDDLCYPRRIELTLTAFQNDPDLDVFYGDIDIWEEDIGIVRDRKTPALPYSLERLRRTSFIPHPTVAIKRQVLINYPYNQYFRMAEDYELLTRLAVAGKKFGATSKKLVKYRQGKQNTSSAHESRKTLVEKYDSLVKMIRGWLSYDSAILAEIEELESVEATSAK